jgi:hypothetical protein
MEDQFDAVLYLGPMSSLTFTRPSLGPCSDPAFEERLRRMSLNPPSRTQIDRLRQTCSK